MVLEQSPSEGGRWGRQPKHTVWLALQPTKALLSHCRPPAEAEVAVAPGACHLMTVLAGPDVPQTLQHRSGPAWPTSHRGHSSSN